jgi:hypothetical protein
MIVEISKPYMNDTSEVINQAKYTRSSDIEIFPVFIKDDVNKSAFLPFQIGADVVLSSVLGSPCKI